MKDSLVYMEDSLVCLVNAFRFAPLDVKQTDMSQYKAKSNDP